MPKLKSHYLPYNSSYIFYSGLTPVLSHLHLKNTPGGLGGEKGKVKGVGVLGKGGGKVW